MYIATHTPFRLETRRLRVVKFSKKCLYTKEKKIYILKVEEKLFCFTFLFF